MSAETQLPEGFQDLEPLVLQWARATFGERMHARHGGTMSDMKSFYDAVAPRAEAILQALQEHPLHDLPPPQQRLYRLLMALGHVAHAIERHAAPIPAGTRYPHSLHVVTGPKPA